MANTDRMLPVKAVADEFACSRKTIERLYANGKFPNAVRVGNLIRIPVGDVAALRQKPPSGER